MKIAKTENMCKFGEKGYLTINNEDYSIVKEIEKDKKYIVVNNLSEVYFLDKVNKEFELIWE